MAQSCIFHQTPKVCRCTALNRAEFAGGSNFQIGWSHHEQDDEQVFTGSARARCAIGAGHEGDYPSRWAACQSVSAKIGCSAHTLFDWVKKAEVDSGKRAGISTDVAEKLKALERENRELRQANEILRKASAYFAQAELDRPLKR